MGSLFNDAYYTCVRWPFELVRTVAQIILINHSESVGSYGVIYNHIDKDITNDTCAAKYMKTELSIDIRTKYHA